MVGRGSPSRSLGEGRPDDGLGIGGCHTLIIPSSRFDQGLTGLDNGGRRAGPLVGVSPARPQEVSPMPEHYSGNDPATGCGLMMLGGACVVIIIIAIIVFVR